LSRKAQIIQLANEGYNYTEIANIVGVTRQYVTQVFRQCGLQLPDFRRLTDEQCVYPNFRNWWNDNRMTYHKFFELAGILYHETNIARLNLYLSGKGNPRMAYIDKMIAATGIPYETLFNKEGG
jgi:hypothetical protein